MMRVLVGLICVLAVAGTATASEPEPGNFNLTFGGGFNVPSSDEADNGYIVGAGLGYQLTPRLILGAEISYLGYDAEQDVNGNAPNESVVDYLATGKYFVRDGKHAPYLKGFAGQYDYDFDSAVGAASYSHSDLVYGGGFGLLVRGDTESNLYVEVLARQLQLESHRTRLYTLTVGVDIGFLP
ncbi:MAG: porin family protein [bacterium]|nr:porin family protein [bacterium]